MINYKDNGFVRAEVEFSMVYGLCLSIQSRIADIFILYRVAPLHSSQKIAQKFKKASIELTLTLKSDAQNALIYEMNLKIQVNSNQAV
jgi:hypothetical protein